MFGDYSDVLYFCTDRDASLAILGRRGCAEEQGLVMRSAPRVSTKSELRICRRNRKEYVHER